MAAGFLQNLFFYLAGDKLRDALGAGELELQRERAAAQLLALCQDQLTGLIHEKFTWRNVVDHAAL